MSKEHLIRRSNILQGGDEVNISNGEVGDMLHTLAECEAALSDDAHETHRGRLAQIRWLLIGLGAGKRLESESEVREG